MKLLSLVSFISAVLAQANGQANGGSPISGQSGSPVSGPGNGQANGGPGGLGVSFPGPRNYTVITASITPTPRETETQTETETPTPSSSDSTTPTPSGSASASWSPTPTETEQPYSSPIYRATPSTSPTPAPTLTYNYSRPVPIPPVPSSSSSETAGIATGVVVGGLCLVAAGYMVNKNYPAGNYRRSLRSPMRRASSASMVTPNPILNLASNTAYKSKTAIETVNVV